MMWLWCLQEHVILNIEIVLNFLIKYLNISIRGIMSDLLRKYRNFRPMGRGIKPNLLVRRSESEGGLKNNSYKTSITAEISYNLLHLQNISIFLHNPN